MTGYKIIKTDMGYLPLYASIPDMWRVVESGGALGVYVESAISWPKLFHADERGAGECINAHSRFCNAEVVWEAKE